MGQLICCKSNHFDSTEFAQILTAYAVDHQPLDLRAAVVKALVTSELMNEILSYTSGQQTNPQTPYLLLLLVLRLLQDDDLEVRKSANLALSQMHRNSASIEHRQPVVESKSMELVSA